MNSNPKTRRRNKVVHSLAKKRALSPSGAASDGGVKKKTVLHGKERNENAEETNQTEIASPKVQVEFVKWLEKRGLTIEDLLKKTVKLGKPPATKQHQTKLTELSSVITEFRAAAKHLLSETTRLAGDLQTLEEERNQLLAAKDDEKSKSEARICQLGDEICQLEGKYKEMQSYVEKLQCYNSDLQGEVRQQRCELHTTEMNLRTATEESVVAKGRNEVLNEKLKEKEEVAQSTIRVLESKVENLKKSEESGLEKIQLLKSAVEVSEKALSETKEELEKWKSEVEVYKSTTGRSAEELEKMECTNNALETELKSQIHLLEDLRKEIMVLKRQKQRFEEQLSTSTSKVAELQLNLEDKEKEISSLEEKLQGAETERRKLHNTIQELKGNIRVFCRVRPAGAEEKTNEPGTQNPIVSFPKQGDEDVDSTLSCLCPPGPQQPFQKFSFCFDRVFRPEATQDNVFEEISQLVQSALDGYRVCIFAYGQTGSGKTYTMLGDKEHRGMIPKSMDQVFSTCTKLEERGWKFAMHASMLEIYNEEYHDLLGEGSSSGGKKHVVSHDSQGNTTVSDLVMMNVRQPGKVETLLSKALNKRSTGSTLLNEKSSRSHFVFTLKLEGRNFDTEQKVQGILNLIDLAGSERVKESGAQGVRLKEAQNINKSLSSLGDVIMALSNKADHIPYRNSKLTWLLQPCLGKDAKTLMFVNISPGQAYCNESICSLRFASKVNACEIGIAKKMSVNTSKTN